MTARFLDLMTLSAALGCGLIAGVFFGFSAFVMKALSRLPPAQGVAAMQSINVAVINPWFMLVFLGTAGACLVLAASPLLRWNDSGAGYLLTGSLLYLVGTFGVTMAFNVPRNNALAALDAASVDAARLWPAYVESWTVWNHVRTAAALAAAASLTVGLCLSGR